MKIQKKYAEILAQRPLQREVVFENFEGEFIILQDDDSVMGAFGPMLSEMAREFFDGKYEFVIFSIDGRVSEGTGT